METIVAGKIDEGTVVDDAAGIAFADHSRLHTVVKHFARSAAQRLESPSMAAQDSRQILVDDEAALRAGSRLRPTDRASRVRR